MRSLGILAVAALLFGGFLFFSHRRAADLRANESAVLHRMRELGRAAEHRPAEERGYLFRWVEGAGLPALLVARPEERGRDGVRWFATADGNAIYEFDTVLNRAKADEPDPETLRRFLALPEEERAEADGPFGWRRAR